MHRSKKTAHDKKRDFIEGFDHLSRVLQMSKAMQVRYKLIPASALNKVTVAGVRDMKLGRVKDGQPVGANVVRFNNPSPGTNSDFHRICIDPKGVSNKGNPHIPVSAGTVKAAESIQKGLKVTGTVLLVVSVVASGIRIGKAIYDEVKIDEEVEALEEIVDCLEEDLKNCDASERAKTRKALEFSKTLLADARDCQRYPGKKSVLTSLCIGGEWAGAAALGYACAQGGKWSIICAAVGSLAGPIGGIAGAVTGGVVGAVAGSELGASAVENFRVDEDGLATELQGSLIDIGKEAKVLGVDGNVFVGKGVEVGARASLFHDERCGGDESIDVGKVGASFGISNKGVDVGVEGKVVWTEVESGNKKMGFGLNADTGYKVSKEGVEMSVLGIGFSVGDDGVGFKLPFFSCKWKK